MGEKPLPLAVPTVSLLVPNSRDYMRVYAVRSRKFPGGVILPGGRLKFWEESPEMRAILEGEEELGLKLKGDQLTPLTTRFGVRRDVRPGGSFEKYLQGGTPPKVLADIPDGTIERHHGPDAVFRVGGIDVDPETLVPTDRDEIVAVVLIDLREPLPPMPISDDHRLLQEWVRFLSTDFGVFPAFFY